MREVSSNSFVSDTGRLLENPDYCNLLQNLPALSSIKNILVVSLDTPPGVFDLRPHWKDFSLNFVKSGFFSSLPVRFLI